MGLYRAGDLGLRAIRESRGTSLDEIAHSTKINPFYLRAIEDGNLDKFPGEFYARSYVRQYARAVGLNGDELLELFDLVPPTSDALPSPADVPVAILRPAEGRR